ncbi:MAG TPA: hypothetical protein PLL00_06905 [Bacteroidia bacterium]|nr:hypothetical protein [Bacteroidia bacterium]
MKRLLSILLLFGILLQSLGKFIIYANYELNKEAITMMFCENKSKPKMNCNGKCHMMKQMKEQEKKENTPVNTLKEKYENQISTASYSFRIITTYTIISHSSVYKLHESISHLNSIFHPPSC